MKLRPYDKPAHNELCQRIAHDQSACGNLSGDPAACAPGCQPAPCRADGDHPGGDHLNPRLEYYDGPILPGYREGRAWRAILAVLPDTAETRVAVHHLIEAAREADQQAVNARVDRDRGIREALARSGSCEVHGQEIKALGEQLHAADRRHDKAEAARLTLLAFLNAVDELVRAPREGLTVKALLDALAAAVKKTGAAHTRAWSA